MVTDRQVRELWKRLAQGGTLEPIRERLRPVVR